MYLIRFKGDNASYQPV